MDQISSHLGAAGGENEDEEEEEEDDDEEDDDDDEEEGVGTGDVVPVTVPVIQPGQLSPSTPEKDSVGVVSDLEGALEIPVDPEPELVPERDTDALEQPEEPTSSTSGSPQALVPPCISSEPESPSSRHVLLSSGPCMVCRVCPKLLRSGFCNGMD
uniref:Uncharacterized protein n=1 Tax=Knipowitschia caucasica TaxID=637954 RepID=A0AAV2KIH1_KNICA